MGPAIECLIFLYQERTQAGNWCSFFFPPFCCSAWPLGIPGSLRQILFSVQACIKLVSVEAMRDGALWSGIWRCVPPILLDLGGASALLLPTAATVNLKLIRGIIAWMQNFSSHPASASDYWLGSDHSLWSGLLSIGHLIHFLSIMYFLFKAGVEIS